MLKLRIPSYLMWVFWPDNRFYSTSLFLNVVLSSGATAATTTLGEVTVTGTREATSITETAAAVGVIQGKEIDELKAAHPWYCTNQA